MSSNLVVIGVSGSIGCAVTKRLRYLYPDANIYVFSRSIVADRLEGVVYGYIDYSDESTIEKAAKDVYEKSGAINLVFVATGILHTSEIKPQKALKELSADKFIELFQANTIFPALVAKYFIPKLAKDNKSVFAAISARVGSISDNQLGGWYAYRASKKAFTSEYSASKLVEVLDSLKLEDSGKCFAWDGKEIIP